MPLSDQKYTALLENLMVNLTDAVYFKDLESRFIRVNDACARKHGWNSPADAVGKTDFDFFAKEHAERAYQDERRIMQTGQPRRAYEEQEIHRDGTVTWAFTTKMPLRDKEGTIIGVFGVTRDITKRKQAELRAAKLREEIKGIKEEMEHDVRMAGKLQKNFIPVSYPVIPVGAAEEERAVEFLHRFNLNRQVSGDYCAVFSVGDSKAGCFLCDVRGVGIRAALGTALIRGIVQEIQELADEPGAYLARMSALLHPLLHKEELTLDVSACYFTIDARSGTLALASAGHAMPLHFHDGHAARRVCDDDDCVGPVLAAAPDTQYRAIEQPLAVGDAVVAFSDGLHRTRNTMDDEYGLKRLLDSAHSLAGEPLADVFDGLEGDALAFSARGTFEDDVCLVGFHLKKLLA